MSKVAMVCVDSARISNLREGLVYLVEKDHGEYVFVYDMAGTYLCNVFKDRFKATDDDKQPEAEYTGGSSSYYDLEFDGVTICCNDVIEKLQMNYAEGNAFKAIWRSCASRNLGKKKAGAKDDGLYDAEKVEFFGKRMVEQAKLRK